MIKHLQSKHKPSAFNKKEKDQKTRKYNHVDIYYLQNITFKQTFDVNFAQTCVF